MAEAAASEALDAVSGFHRENGGALKHRQGFLFNSESDGCSVQAVEYEEAGANIRFTSMKTVGRWTLPQKEVERGRD